LHLGHPTDKESVADEEVDEDVDKVEESPRVGKGQPRGGEE